MNNLLFFKLLSLYILLHNINTWYLPIMFYNFKKVFYFNIIDLKHRQL